ncbi:Hypothetical_protein [Hexamita inflata]|uniref:Hypothetical_protein n=1 Tax=Hexamita inflata TaxID=28002 RepID=A0ABP1K180_9EUKA
MNSDMSDIFNYLGEDQQQKQQQSLQFIQQHQYAFEFLHNIDQYLNIFSADQSDINTQKIAEYFKKFQQGDILKQTQVKTCPNKILAQLNLPTIISLDKIYAQNNDFFQVKSDACGKPLMQLRFQIQHGLMQTQKQPTRQNKQALTELINEYHRELQFRTSLQKLFIEQLPTIEQAKKQTSAFMNNLQRLSVDQLSMLQSSNATKLDVLQISKTIQTIKSRLQTYVLFTPLQQPAGKNFEQIQRELLRNEPINQLYNEYLKQMHTYLKEAAGQLTKQYQEIQQISQNELQEFQKLAMNFSRLNITQLVIQLKQAKNPKITQKMNALEQKCADNLMQMDHITVKEIIGQLSDPENCKAQCWKIGWLLKGLMDSYKMMHEK